MCCDNFGSVTSSGTHAPNVGGVCAVPHAAVVVGDCVNYGTVKVSNDTAGALGGISGGVNRPARIRGCINHGEIIYEGFSLAISSVVFLTLSNASHVFGGYTSNESPGFLLLNISISFILFTLSLPINIS